MKTPLVIIWMAEPISAMLAPMIAAWARSTVISHSMPGTGAVSSMSIRPTITSSM